MSTRQQTTTVSKFTFGEAAKVTQGTLSVNYNPKFYDLRNQSKVG